MRWWPPYALFAGWVAVSIPLLYFITVHDQALHPPTCFGIGWGCTPDPASTVGLYLIFIATPALVVGTVVLAVLGFFGRSTRVVRATLSGAIPPLFLLWILVFA